ncbi:MAG: hypothetical protein ALECFALPRED_010419 [Alectoria fallacina]|uniref:Phytanoyl-CoA dioxygenase n=1 Tax=Alectoria fallacina TaxID=1903189 RepID=A0A8H3J954_9LECA|nr:MAG: hypothetical protein ALECFALPRED_010419 [Alectoria fallacina]
MARRVAFKDTVAVIQNIKEDGGVILTNFSSNEDVQRVNTDAAPYIQKIIDDRASQSLPRETSRCFRLFGRSRTAREGWLQQPAFLEVLNHFLRTETVPDNEYGSTVIETNAILSAAATLDIGPGVKAQDLHRDDFIWQQTHTVKEGQGYQMGSDVSMGLLVPGVNTTKANGATLVEKFLATLSPYTDGAQFVPGSHLWDHSRRPKKDAVAVEMAVGEAFLFLGSTVHAGVGWIFPFLDAQDQLKGAQENQHLLWSKDEVQQWSLAAQKQAGYVLDNPFLGHCDEKNPVDVVGVDAEITG